MKWLRPTLIDVLKHFWSSALAGLLAYSLTSIIASRYYCTVRGLPYKTLPPEQAARRISRLSWSAALFSSIALHCLLDR